MDKQIVTAGTLTGKWEDRYVRDAVKHLGDPDKFNFYIKEFERRFAEYIGAKYAIATTNGTAALHTGLLALGVGKGDEVILPNMTYISCANVIAYTGARPIFVDINSYGWCIDPQSIKKAITRRTKAIMPVWMYGNAPNMQGIIDVAHGIPIIEDSCPAVGSRFQGKHAGTFGEIGCFSFQGAKVLAIGEGGMMVTNNQKLYEKAKLLVDMYTTKEFWQTKTGYMYEMNNISAAVGLGQLEHIDKILEKKKQIYGWYAEELKDLYKMNCFEEYGVSCKGYGCGQNYWMTSIVTPSQIYRKKLREHLRSHNIDTRPFFYPITMFGMYPQKHKTPESYRIGLTGINLPSTVRLSEKEVKYVAATVKDFSTHYKRYFK